MAEKGEKQMRWSTCRDAYDGLETFLDSGPKSMIEIAAEFRNHGCSDFDAISTVGHLVSAGRIEQTTRPFSSGHLSGVYRRVVATAGGADRSKEPTHPRSFGQARRGR